MPASGLKTVNPWLWIPSLYLAEGLPNAIVVTLSVVMLKSMGLTNELVTFYTSLLYLPWVIKPFWAPFVDMFATKRRWIVAMQLAIFIGLATICCTLHTPRWFAFALGALWWTALSSATHDIAADGFYMLALTEREQSFFVGIRNTFYRAANMIASGGMVWAAGRLIDHGLGNVRAWQMIFAGAAALFLIAGIYHGANLPHPSIDKPAEKRRADDVFNEFGRTIATFFKKKGIFTAMAFILLYRLPEAVIGKMVQPFLLDPRELGGMGMSVAQVGVANGIYGVTGIVIGGIVGGILMSKIGLRRSLWPMALMLTIPTAFYLYLALAHPHSLMIVNMGIAIEQFGYGFGFTAYTMYMMKFCEDSEFTTSHYAFCTGLMALGLMLPGMAAGWLQQQLGYTGFFALIMILCIPTFAVTELIRRK